MLVNTTYFLEQVGKFGKTLLLHFLLKAMPIAWFCFQFVLLNITNSQKPEVLLFNRFLLKIFSYH